MGFGGNLPDMPSTANTLGITNAQVQAPQYTGGAIDQMNNAWNFMGNQLQRVQENAQKREAQKLQQDTFEFDKQKFYKTLEAQKQQQTLENTRADKYMERDMAAAAREVDKYGRDLKKEKDIEEARTSIMNNMQEVDETMQAVVGGYATPEQKTKSYEYRKHLILLDPGALAAMGIETLKKQDPENRTYTFIEKMLNTVKTGPDNKVIKNSDGTQAKESSITDLYSSMGSATTVAELKALQAGKLQDISNKIFSYAKAGHIDVNAALKMVSEFNKVIEEKKVSLMKFEQAQAETELTRAKATGKAPHNEKGDTVLQATNEPGTFVDARTNSRVDGRTNAPLVKVEGMNGEYIVYTDPKTGKNILKDRNGTTIGNVIEDTSGVVSYVDTKGAKSAVSPSLATPDSITSTQVSMKTGKTTTPKAATKAAGGLNEMYKNELKKRTEANKGDNK